MARTKAASVRWFNYFRPRAWAGGRFGPTDLRRVGMKSALIRSRLAGENFLPRVPLGRVGETDEIAGLSVFSCLPSCPSYVDGGY